MNVVVIVDVTVFIQTADSSMKVGNFAIGFLMQPDRVFAVSQIGLAGADFSVLAGKYLFVKLRSEILPELLPVFDVEETGVFGRGA